MKIYFNLGEFMLYKSTRSSANTYTGSQAIIKGLADDGGLLVPVTIPTIDYKHLLNMTYQEIGTEILSLYLPEYKKDTLLSFFKKAYGNEKFSDKILDVVETSLGEYTLELWHGPTAAFKDFALMLMPYLLQEAKNINHNTDETIILVATSGDTGKAALEGYKDIDGIKISVFYPHNGTSEVQKLQMATQEGENVSVFAVVGNFDDVQTAVKKAFSSEELLNDLKTNHKTITSANSINWGRLVPQIVYYFYAYLYLVKSNQIQADDIVDFCVPTGNFGDIMAGYYAKKMGLPIGKLICASNQNNILSDFFKTGIYDANRAFYKTTSPSMDILVSSNLERLLYDILQDETAVKNLYDDFAKTKCFTISEDTLKELQKIFYADFATDDLASETIASKFKEQHYLCDPHTAIAYHVAKQFKKEKGTDTPCVILSTASPYKFSNHVLSSIHTTVPADEFDTIHLLEDISKTTAPAQIKILKSKQIRFTSVILPSEISKIAKEL